MERFMAEDRESANVLLLKMLYKKANDFFYISGLLLSYIVLYLVSGDYILPQKLQQYSKIKNSISDNIYQANVQGKETQVLILELNQKVLEKKLSSKKRKETDQKSQGQGPRSRSPLYAMTVLDTEKSFLFTDS